MPRRPRPATARQASRSTASAATPKKTSRTAVSTAAPEKLAEYRRKRDFSRTAEPSGARSTSSRGALHFVIQKHAASHLHYDFRLELDGVMKSWAVPKGPSLDPAVKRLAMEVEDHPIEYNAFEGTIPKGEYGGGTVMLWDQGTYTADAPGKDPVAALREGYKRGDLKFVLFGERLRGSWVLVRTRRGEEGKPQWLLIKHRDEYAEHGAEITDTEITSVVTGRTMEEIATGASKVWHSNRPARGKRALPDEDGASATPAASSASARHAGTRSTEAARTPSRRSMTPAVLEPMLATVGDAVPHGPGWSFEPKYDGIRLLAFATPRAVRLISRNGKDKTAQFPEIAESVRTLVAKVRHPLVLDGEAVALVDGVPARFQELQQRMHVKDADAIESFTTGAPAAYIAFDLLLDGDDVLVHEPWSERRRRLEQRLRNRTTPALHLGESVPGDGAEMLKRAAQAGWEGIIAKRTDARYEPGHRSRSWLKLKIELRQEFVVGGYTEPRNSREYIGALLLGYFDGDRFLYVGHTGGGFDRAGLKAMYERLHPLERKTSPFEETPKTNERAHWVRPEVVVEVKFSEWTSDGKLRQPIYLGTRDDKDAHDVRREPMSMQRTAQGDGARSGEGGKGKAPSRSRGSASRATASARATTRSNQSAEAGTGANASIVQQLDVIEKSKGSSGTVRIARGVELDVSHLGKVYFPADRITKGDVLRYYVRAATGILAAMADRPLVLKRTPDGIDGETFFQQKAPDHVPDGVRVDSVDRSDGALRLIGGDLITLLYTAQLGCISVDPWHSRIESLDSPDYTILDLDPGPRAPFSRVVEVAGMVKGVLDQLKLHAAIKTSGSRGMHIGVPLPADTSYETALLVAQVIAARVASANPKVATIERSVKARPPAAVYVDCLQNIRGKSVAAAFSVRARPGATVSTPLDWSELDPALDPREFTIESVPVRLAASGDLWAAAMKRRNTVDALRKVANL